MAKVRILRWKDIPAVVEASDAEGVVKLQLSERFQALIDSVAMRLGLSGTDDYLDQWELGDEEDRPGAARQVAEALVQELEGRFGEFCDRGLDRA